MILVSIVLYGEEHHKKISGYIRVVDESELNTFVVNGILEGARQGQGDIFPALKHFENVEWLYSVAKTSTLKRVAQDSDLPLFEEVLTRLACEVAKENVKSATLHLNEQKKILAKVKNTYSFHEINTILGHPVWISLDESKHFS